jgi:hypothetical protein
VAGGWALLLGGDQSRGAASAGAGRDRPQLARAVGARCLVWPAAMRAAWPRRAPAAGRGKAAEVATDANLHGDDVGALDDGPVGRAVVPSLRHAQDRAPLALRRRGARRRDLGACSGGSSRRGQRPERAHRERIGSGAEGRASHLHADLRRKAAASARTPRRGGHARPARKRASARQPLSRARGPRAPRCGVARVFVRTWLRELAVRGRIAGWARFPMGCGAGNRQ